MSPLQRETLWMLVIYGPISIALLARRMKQDRDTVYRVVYGMTRRGWAAWLGPSLWDATQLGRRTVTQVDRDASDKASLPLFENLIAEIGVEKS